MSKKIFISYQDGNNYTLIFDDNSQGLLSFLLDLSERTNCSIELLSGFSNQETDFIKNKELEE